MKITLVDELDLAHWVTINARKNGASDVALDINKSRDVSVSFRDGKMDELKESTQNSMTLSIYLDGKYSSHSTNDMRHDSLLDFVDKAVDITKYLGADEFRKLPDPKYFQNMESHDLQIRDAAYESIKSDQRVEIARTLEEIGRAADDKVVSCTGEYGDTYTESLKVRTNGFVGERKSTSFYSSCDISVKDSAGNILEGFDSTTTRYFSELGDSEAISKTAVKKALDKIGQKKISSGVYDMVVINRRVSRLLGSVLGALRGSSLQQKRSFLADMLGKKIASDKLTVVDDPFISKGLGSRLYDSEGLAVYKRPLVENGILQTYLIDTYYGRKLGMEPNVGSTSNLILENGTKSLKEIIQGLKKGILVTSFLGGNSNSTTGDFSYGVSGFLIEDGEMVTPVNELNISGNYKELLNQVVEIGNDPYLYSSRRFPSIHFTDVNFSGK